MSDSIGASYERYLEQAYLMTKTFASLQLEGRAAICDSLLAMVTTFTDAQGAVLLVDREGVGLVVAATRGEAMEEELSAATAQELMPLVDQGIAQHLDEAAVARLVPPLASRVGALAVAGMRAGDTTLGLLLLEHRGAADDQAVLAFLTAAAGIGSLALTNADAVADARALTLSLERTAEAARRESANKSKLLVAISGQLRTIHEQQQQIEDIAFPLLTVSKRIVVAPVIGKVDSERGDVFAERILTGIAATRAEILIIDVTGAVIVGEGAGERLLHLVKSVRLLGIQVALTGMQKGLAVSLGEDGLRSLGNIETFSSLENGLRFFAAR